MRIAAIEDFTPMVVPELPNLVTAEGGFEGIGNIFSLKTLFMVGISAVVLGFGYMYLSEYLRAIEYEEDKKD